MTDAIQLAGYPVLANESVSSMQIAFVSTFQNWENYDTSGSDLPPRHEF